MICEIRENEPFWECLYGDRSSTTDTELLQNHVPYKNLYFCTITNERMCNKEELASYKKHEKRVFLD